MGKRLGIAVAFCCMLVLSFALAGCGTNVDKSNYTGEWALVSSSDEDLDVDSVALMQSLGLEASLTLDEDGTGVLDMFGDEDDVSWEAKSNTEGKIVVDGSETSMKLANGELTLADVDGASFTFSRK